ncbi:MAG: ATPase [Deltaproteobacteria bacterium GWB2_55_19]|nr:MAG: ATPase [Deltaproteobacteria bacterium GWB2_55_19]
MRPNDLKNEIKSLYGSRQPLYCWGPPGVGKSSVVAQAAAELGKEIRDVRALLLDPVDLRGIPQIRDGRVLWCVPNFLPTDGEGILFLDELNAAPQMVQAACYQLVLDRMLGEYRLPDGWTIIAAGNEETDRAAVHRMPSPLANRFVHLKYEVNLEDWVAWALKAGVMTEVIACLRFRPALLHQFDPKRNEKSFPTPRSWEFVSRMLTGRNNISAIEYELVAGAVGEGAAAEFIGFLKVFKSLPNPDAVIMSPKTASIPTDPATLYAICGALARKASENTIGRIVEYANRLPAEYSILLMRDASRQSPEVVNTRAYIEWVSAHDSVLI